MGDVAISVSAIHNVLDNNPDVEIVLLTKTPFWPLFGAHPRLIFHAIDLKGNHKGFRGLKRLHSELKQYNISAYADLHDVLRTKVLRGFYSVSKKAIAVINKERTIKENIVKKKLPISQQRHSLDRYLDVFEKLNLKVDRAFDYQLALTDSIVVSQFIDGFHSEDKLYGIAPFAAHGAKEWGLDNIKRLMELMLQDNTIKILLFGGGPFETKYLQELAQENDNIYAVAGAYSLLEEVQLMKKCQSILAMDSANMHLADLAGVKVVSTWTSTHPCFGFYPLHNLKNCLFPSDAEMPSFPISIYGKLKSTKDTAQVEQARKMITPEKVWNKMK
ncbi:MAG: ADP-heptose:LPS heptosyltransferase [Parvicella sp.]|jgi:ADP-heptose:LPS heptosyltransferase